MRLFFILSAAMLCQTVLATDYYVDPKNGNDSAAGRSNSPWKTIQFTKLKAKDKVNLRSGEYGTLAVSGQNGDYITITAAKRSFPVFNSVRVSGSKWVIRGLTVRPLEHKGKPKAHGKRFGPVLMGVSGSDIIVEDSFFYQSLDSSSWGLTDWLSASNGLTTGTAPSTRITIRNCHFLNLRFCVGIDSTDSVIEGCIIDNYSADGLRLCNHGCIARYNVIKNANVGMGEGDKNHDDAIQSFLSRKGKGLVKRQTISKNIILAHDGRNGSEKWATSFQAIGLFDGPLERFTVTDNVISALTWHGVALYDTYDSTITGNTVWSPSPTHKVKPWVMLGTKRRAKIVNNVVKDNYAFSFRNISKKTCKEHGNNKKGSKAIFEKAKADLLVEINDKFGKHHPVSGYERVGRSKIDPKKVKRLSAKKSSSFLR